MYNITQLKSGYIDYLTHTFADNHKAEPVSYGEGKEDNHTTRYIIFILLSKTKERKLLGTLMYYTMAQKQFENSIRII
jgi:hypothetical protein